MKTVIPNMFRFFWEVLFKGEILLVGRFYPNNAIVRSLKKSLMSKLPHAIPVLGRWKYIKKRPSKIRSCPLKWKHWMFDIGRRRSGFIYFVPTRLFALRLPVAYAITSTSTRLSRCNSFLLCRHFQGHQLQLPKNSKSHVHIGSSSSFSNTSLFAACLNCLDWYWAPFLFFFLVGAYSPIRWVFTWKDTSLFSFCPFSFILAVHPKGPGQM